MAHGIIIILITAAIKTLATILIMIKRSGGILGVGSKIKCSFTVWL
jgi:hypothetical protein